MSQAGVHESLSPRHRTRGGTYARRREPSLALDLAEALESIAGKRWPDLRYANDPVGFVEEILGDSPTAKQIEILEAVRDCNHVAIKSGHKVGKSRVDVWLALWWFCTRVDARVLFTSSAERQVDKVLWRELVLVIRRSGIPLDCRPAEHAKTGLIAPDLREIVGLSAREAEAVAGTSGVAVLYLVDEASGCAETLFAAFEGNLAGGGKMVLTSNPTRTTGKFFDVFQPSEQIENGGEWKTLSVASTETPNAISGEMLVPGLATREWCEARKAAWGEDSLDYKVRVLGQFPTNEERKMLTIHQINEAVDRYEETPATGELRGGIDVAGSGPNGDETVCVFRRGKKVVRIARYRSITVAGLLVNLRAHLLELAEGYSDREPPRIAIDAEAFGFATYAHIASWAASSTDNAREMTVVGIHAGHRAQRAPDRFDRVRDELFAACEEWVKAGGAIPPDPKLQQELHAPEWHGTPSGRAKATDKDTLRKILGRSPDSFDALCLACWEPDNVEAIVARNVAANAQEAAAAATRRVPRMDPYAAENAWRGNR